MKPAPEIISTQVMVRTLSDHLTSDVMHEHWRVVTCDPRRSDAADYEGGLGLKQQRFKDRQVVKRKNRATEADKDARRALADARIDAERLTLALRGFAG